MKTNIEPFEKFGFEDNKIGIDNVSITYLQNSDCSGDDEPETVQQITLSTRNNGISRFVNIKTDSWSIDDSYSITDIIEDFKKRAELIYDEDGKETGVQEA